MSELLAKGKWVVFLLFAASRLPIAMTEPPGSTLAGVNVVYAFEVQRAAALGLPFYEMHEQNRQDADPAASPVERLVEYPPLAILWMSVPTWFLDPIPKSGIVPDAQIEAAKRANRFAMFAVDLCGFGLLLLMGATAARLAVYTAGGLLLFPVLYERFDLVLGVLLFAALMLLVRKLPAWAPLAVLAIAINFKVTPLVLVPLFALGTLPADALLSPVRIGKRLAMLVAMTAAIFAPFFARDGAATLGFLKYHAARGLQIESVWSTLPVLTAALFGWPAGTPIRYGAVEVDSAMARTLGTMASVATLAVIPMVSVALWRLLRKVGRSSDLPSAAAGRGQPHSTLAQANPALFLQCAAVSLLAAMASSKVFSPQYLLWVLPLVAMWEGRRVWMVWTGFLGICALTTWSYPFNYTPLLLVTHAGQGLSAWYRLLGAAPLTLRNLLLVAFTVACWNDTARGTTAGSTAGDAIPGAPASRQTRAR